MELWNCIPLDLEAFSDLRLAEPDHLSPIQPHFFFPPLKDTPQDPILDAIKRSASKLRRFEGLEPNLPKELAILTADLVGLDTGDNEAPRPRSPTTFWTSVYQSQLQPSSSTVSWDRLRPTHTHQASTTAFLSEQDGTVFAYAREHIQPGSSQTGHFVSAKELHHSIRLTIIGTSSRLFRWDAFHEKFIYLAEGTRHLRVQERDEVISSSIVDRFLTIGTLLRRLEEFVKTLRLRTVKDGPTVHALAHALSTVLVYLRESLVNTSSRDDTDFLTAIWSRYGPFEDILNALSDFYERVTTVRASPTDFAVDYRESQPQEREPKDYPQFESSPVKIISGIYKHLASHLERQSSPIISAIFAYLLDATSQGYLHEVGVSIGYGGQPRKQPTKADERDEYALDNEDDEDEDIFFALEAVQTDFPEFFPKPLLDVLPTAQKSLILLRKAQPDHPLLGQESKNKRVRWLWSESDILVAWEDAGGEVETPSTLPPDDDAAVLHQPSHSYKPEISEFQVFDMEPGNFVARSALQVVDRSSAVLETFIRQFPTRLPSIAPTLPHLTSLVFHKLLEHASTISSTLLSIFLNSSGNLNLQLHLSLLRSYLLVTAPAFKTRLLEALFSDAGEYGIDTSPHSMSLRYVRRRSSKKVKESKQPWAVGISPNLLDREVWPPVSGDLSFFLRTVIVDSLDKGKENAEGGEEEGEEKKQHIVLDEATWRIGFAIRDLPVGSGRDKWLNPLCIEALDFLYMDYKPPRPMDVLISPQILSKYQRVFAFILRLFRVECAVKSVFRMTRVSAVPLFPTLSKYRKLLLHFRFIAQSFVSTLSSYVFDTAIGGNFDPFLEQLSASATTTASPSAFTETAPGFSDVFELASAHSVLLDRILTACLLRSGQKAVGELLRHSLELVLEFCIIVGELQRGRLQEYEAAPMIEDIYDKFKGKMMTFMKVLKSLVEKGPTTATRWPMQLGTGVQRPTGGTAALHQLLMRLDLGEWWTQLK